MYEYEEGQLDTILEQPFLTGDVQYVPTKESSKDLANSLHTFNARATPPNTNNHNRFLTTYGGTLVAPLPKQWERELSGKPGVRDISECYAVHEQ